MKKNLKKLALNKKAVSNLSKVSGGLARAGETAGILTCTDPTLLTMCYICPVKDPIDTIRDR